MSYLGLKIKTTLRGPDLDWDFKIMGYLSLYFHVVYSPKILSTQKLLWTLKVSLKQMELTAALKEFSAGEQHRCKELSIPYVCTMVLT